MTGYRIGVDEAGKGPVLGPMVAAAVRGSPSDLPDGLADSKRLSAPKRESLAAELRNKADVDIAVGVVEVDEIDDPKTDMNRLTVAAHVRAITQVAAAGDEAIVDAGDVSESRFGRRVREGVANEGIELSVTAEHGADDSHSLAAAASIIAKVDRDRRMAAVDEQHDQSVGSGYPSDPTTRAFLTNYVETTGELPDCARRSWSTCDDLLAAAEQSGLADF